MNWLLWLHKPSQIDEFYKHSYGDKESFWISCVLAQENCPFNQWAVAVGGIFFVSVPCVQNLFLKW